MSTGSIFSIDAVDQLLKNVQQQLNDNTDANDPSATSPLTASRVLVTDGSGKVSSATETTTDLANAVSHVSNTSNPHTVTKAQMSLDTVDNVEFTNITASGIVITEAEAITSVSAGIAASVAVSLTMITTNGDSDLDNVTLANGTAGQIKTFAIVASGNVADSVKITPANMVGGTQITFGADPEGLGCVMVYSALGWVVVGNNGGVIA